MMVGVLLMGLALFVFWFTNDKEALILLIIWSVSAFFYIETPQWFAFYVLSCGAGCLVSQKKNVILLYILQSVISLICLIEWHYNIEFIFKIHKEIIAALFALQLQGVIIGNIYFNITGNFFNRNLSIQIKRG